MNKGDAEDGKCLSAGNSSLIDRVGKTKQNKLRNVMMVMMVMMMVPAYGGV